jgi:trimeric autotransporter adhesin
MKTTLLSIITLLFAISLQAQLKLDVAGDARIEGRLDLQSTVGGNLFLGFNTGQNNTDGSQNTFVGTKAGEGNETGTANTFLGSYAGVANINGSDNVFVGQGTGGQNISGRYNTFLGSFSGPFNTSGVENTMIGNAAGNLNTSGFRNTFVGRLAGSSNETGQYNTILGAYAGVGSNDLVYATAVGANADVNCSHCLVLGNDDINVGIGTSEPSTTLDVNGKSILQDENRVVTLRSSGSNAFLAFENLGGQAGANIGYFNDNSSAYYYADMPGGLFGEMIIQNNGDIYQNGMLIHSDRRLKSNIQPIGNAIATIQELRGVSYELKSSVTSGNKTTSENMLGLIAQEVEAILPQLVGERPDGYKAVNYIGIVPLLIEGIKVQQKELTTQKEQISNLQKQVRELRSLVEALVAKEKIPSDRDGSEPGPQLYQNHPNPHNGHTIIEYYLPEGLQHARIEIHNVDGKLLRTLPLMQSGKGQIQLNVDQFSAGMYVYSLMINNKVVESKRMILTQ